MLIMMQMLMLMLMLREREREREGEREGIWREGQASPMGLGQRIAGCLCLCRALSRESKVWVWV